MTSLPKELLDKLIGSTLMGRLGRPEELASIIAFLLSDETSWINGQVWHANGGSYFREKLGRRPADTFSSSGYKRHLVC